jgi:hypothetical protein
MKKIFLISIGLIISFPALAQEVNSYQYVVVPKKFEFTKEADMYQVNSLTEFLFHKYGFDAYLEGEELPDEFDQDQCKGLYADVENNSGLFVTRLNIILKDCRNNIIFTSEEGISKAKDYKTAYHEALREAFESVEKLNYSYEPENTVAFKGKIDVDTTDAVPERKTVVVTAIPKIPVEEISSKKDVSEATLNSEEMEFTMAGISYILIKSDKGFDFFQEGMTEPFASLISSNNNKNYIYSSVRDQGIAGFDKDGNLVIEIFERGTNSVQTRTYTLRD